MRLESRIACAASLAESCSAQHKDVSIGFINLLQRFTVFFLSQSWQQLLLGGVLFTSPRRLSSREAEVYTGAEP